jgi:hypothetical protein
MLSITVTPSDVTLDGGKVSLERIVALLGAPIFDGADGSAWEAIGRDFGIGYPEVFRAFVDLYGPGCLNAVRFMHPTAGRIHLADTVLSDIDSRAVVRRRGLPRAARLA